MALLEQETKMFVHRDLLVSKTGVDLLRGLFSSEGEIENHCIIKGITEGNLDIIHPTPAQKSLPLTDTAFQYFVQQKAVDGFIYASAESFKVVLGV